MISYAGIFGLSVQLALLNDVLYLSSFWLMGLYSVFAQIYTSSLSMMGTLLKLFRGRKQNTLRKREDLQEFTLSELYSGVLIMTLSIFLLPTIAMYYFYVFIPMVLNVLALQLTVSLC